MCFKKKRKNTASPATSATAGNCASAREKNAASTSKSKFVNPISGSEWDEDSDSDQESTSIDL